MAFFTEYSAGVGYVAIVFVLLAGARLAWRWWQNRQPGAVHDDRLDAIEERLDALAAHFAIPLPDRPSPKAIEAPEDQPAAELAPPSPRPES